jgi:Asp-tRNA(Asn)/Glu-tRNA(Gln) amidotransferase A subunit family amidase
MSVAIDPVRRREFLAYFGSLGLGATAFPAALLGVAQDGKVTLAAIEQAEKLAGLKFTDAQRKLMERGVADQLAAIEKLREQPLPVDVMPCFAFDPLPPGRARPAAKPRRVVLPKPPPLEGPSDVEEVAFAPLWHLAELVRTGAVSSLELTEMYLARLEKFDAKLLCVVTLLKDAAIASAKQADAEIAAKKYRGPLHGIPWGAKDLLHTKGVRTTYGAEPFQDFVPSSDATVVEKLRDAGAVLVAKTTLGALAMGDVWFGGMTRNPWNLEQGSSGSSAGSAAATVAGLVGFAIGSETLGSIVSPSTRCGATGLRPTFGRVSRAGAMPVAWTMDKLGPLCRSALDCALVFAAIEGRDDRDRSTVEQGFDFDANRPLSELRIGYVASAKAQFMVGAEKNVLDVLKAQGAKVEAVELQDGAANEIVAMLGVEAASAFDDVTRSGAVDRLKEQGPGAWPNTFRTARLMPAVEYLRAARMRTLLCEETARAFGEFDVIVAPTYAGLTLTNLTGHPALVMPSGFVKGASSGTNGGATSAAPDGVPTSVVLLGKLYGEAELLRVGHAFQSATDFHTRTPSAFAK